MDAAKFAAHIAQPCAECGASSVGLADVLAGRTTPLCAAHILARLAAARAACDAAIAARKAVR